MKILTVDNIPYDLNKMPQTVSDDMAFSVLDNSNPKEPDFFFLPLIYIESFNAPAIVLDIGGKEITMPLDWSIAVGDKEDSNTVEVVPLTSIADRGFSAFIFNPLKGFKADFFEVNGCAFVVNTTHHQMKRFRHCQMHCEQFHIALFVTVHTANRSLKYA